MTSRPGLGVALKLRTAARQPVTALTADTMSG